MKNQVVAKDFKSFKEKNTFFSEPNIDNSKLTVNSLSRLLYQAKRNNFISLNFQIK